MNRRSFISVLGSGAVLGLGGCTTVFGNDASVALLQVGVMNWMEESTPVQVRVTLDEEVVESVTDELEGKDGQVLDCTWPTESGQFVVAARLGENDDWEKRDLTDPDNDCAAIWVMIEQPTGPPSMPISRDCERYADRC